MFVDLYSRKIVGWRVHDRDQLIVHSDNGAPMKGATLLATLHRLGIVPSYSRPAVSNDNPYSEALFKTMKYRLDYPMKPFAGTASANTWVEGFVHWYNHQHRHSAIRFVTPAQRHTGLDRVILAQRKATYERAKARDPQRWSGHTRNWDPITEVLLNPDKSHLQEEGKLVA